MKKSVILSSFIIILVVTLLLGYKQVRFTWYFLKGIRALSKYDFENAYNLLNTIDKISNPRINLEPILEQSLLLTAIQCIAKGDNHAALLWLNKIENKSNLSIQAYKIIAYLNTNQETKALEILNYHHDNYYENIDFVVVKANYLAQKDSSKSVDKLYREAQTWVPQNPWIHVYFGDIFWIIGIPQKSLNCYLKSLQINESHATTLIRLGDWYMKWGNNAEKAKKYYFQAINTRTGFFYYDPYYKLSKLLGENVNSGPNPYYKRACSLSESINRYTVRWLKSETLTNFRQPFGINPGTRDPRVFYLN